MSPQASKSSSASEKAQKATVQPGQVPARATFDSAPGMASPELLQWAVAKPEAAQPSEMLALQRKYGNRAVNHLLTSRQLQPKLNVGSAGDQYEQEADQVADQVMRPVLPVGQEQSLLRRATLMPPLVSALPQGSPSGTVQRLVGQIVQSDFQFVLRVRAVLSASGTELETQYDALRADLDTFTAVPKSKSQTVKNIYLRVKANTARQLVATRTGKKGLFHTIRDLVETAYTEYQADRKEEAEQLEEATGGHSLDRHGPDVSDALLKRRLTSGVAPDDVLSVAPGYSSRFADYATWIDARQAAIDKADAALTDTQHRLMVAAPKLAGLGKQEAALKTDLAERTTERSKANVAVNKAKGQQGVGSPEHRQAESKLASIDETMSKTQAKQARVAGHIESVLSSLPLPFKPADIDLGDITSFTLKQSYRLIVDHAKKIGEGFRGTPESAHEVLDLAHKDKTVEKATLYAQTEKVDTLTKSLTTLDTGADQGKALLTMGADGPEPNDDFHPANWTAVQHFPAPPDAAAGIEVSRE
jgi:hypothetical protein